MCVNLILTRACATAGEPNNRDHTLVYQVPTGLSYHMSRRGLAYLPFSQTTWRSNTFIRVALRNMDDHFIHDGDASTLLRLDTRLTRRDFSCTWHSHGIVGIVTAVLRSTTQQVFHVYAYLRTRHWLSELCFFAVSLQDRLVSLHTGAGCALFGHHIGTPPIFCPFGIDRRTQHCTAVDTCAPLCVLRSFPFYQST